MFDFTPEEWQSFTNTEKKMIILARKYNINTHDAMRRYLNWPLEEPMHKRTYENHWSKMQKKMSEIVTLRKEAKRIQLEHADSNEMRQGDVHSE